MYKNKNKKKGKGKNVYSSSESANWDDESAIGIGTTPLVAISTAWQMELIYIELLSCLPAAKQVFVHTDWSELESKFLQRPTDIEIYFWLIATCGPKSGPCMEICWHSWRSSHQIHRVGYKLQHKLYRFSPGCCKGKLPKQESRAAGQQITIAIGPSPWPFRMNLHLGCPSSSWPKGANNRPTSQPKLLQIDILLPFTFFS